MLVNKPQSIVDEPQSIVDEPQSIVDEPQSIVDEPQSIVDEPQSIVDEPQSIVDEPQSIVDEPQSIVDEPQSIVDEPQSIVDEPQSIVDEPQSIPQLSYVTGDLDIHDLSGLSMPHSPRWYRDKLWLLNSGTGEFGYADLEGVVLELYDVVALPGVRRSMAIGFKSDEIRRVITVGTDD